MALSPINIFRPSENSIAQILQGGNAALSQIMSNAVQVGRDIANRGHAQERDTLALRAQETSLAQRRAENNQQNFEDAARFARNAFEFDTKFGADSVHRQQQLGMDAARMAQQQGQFEAGLEFKRADDARADRQLTLQEQEAKRKQAALDAEKSQISSLFSSGESSPPAAGVPPMLENPGYAPRANETPMPAVGSPVTADLSTDERLHAQGKVNAPWAKEVPKQGTLAPVPAASTNDDYSRYASLFEVTNSSVATPAQRSQARAEMMRIKDRLNVKPPETPKPLTQYQQDSANRAAKDQQMQEARDQFTKDKFSFETLLANKNAFALWDEGTKDAPNQTGIDWNSNRPRNELNAALTASSEDYYVNGGKDQKYLNAPKEVKEERRKAYRLAKRIEAYSSGGSAPAASAVDQIPGI